MGSLEKADRHDASAGALVPVEPNSLTARASVEMLWDGTFAQSTDEFVPPTWEALPGAVRWQLTGRDTLRGPSVASFVHAPSTQRRGTDYVEAVSGWLLHESGVFCASAERPLMPIGGRRYRPAGDWHATFRQSQGRAFRFKRGNFPPELSASTTDETGVQPELLPMWRSIPARPRSLLCDDRGRARDHADWWLIAREGELRMTLCYERAWGDRTCAVSQTRVITTSGDLRDAKQLASRLAAASWDVCVFSAERGTSERAVSDAPAASVLEQPRTHTD